MAATTVDQADAVYDRLFRRPAGWRGWRLLGDLHRSRSPAGSLIPLSLDQLGTAPAVMMSLVATGLVDRHQHGKRFFYAPTALGLAVYALGCPCCGATPDA